MIGRGLRLGLVLVCGCAPARLPPEPAVRVAALQRPVDVIVVSSPAGVPVWRAGADGAPGEHLGVTPVVIDRIEVHKETWKHGELPPPPSRGDAVLERAPGAADRSDGSLRWLLLVGAPPRPVELAAAPAALEHGFRDGRLELRLPAVGVETEP